MTEIVDKVNDSATNVKTTTVDVKAAAVDVRAAAVDVKATAKEVRELVVDNRQNIDGTIEELRQAAARLNLGMEDIRRNPWKLLTRNIEADAYTQNIYDASMEFAEGARTLSLASANLRAMASQPNADPEKVKKATEEISRLVAEMSKLQARLYEAMKARPR
jgi:methyl-accepting chemotaxis protein